MLIVNCDLKSAKLDADGFDGMLQGIGGEVKRVMDSTWIVDTRLSANDYSQQILKHLSEGDRFFVAKIEGRDRQGMIAKTSWDWVRQRENLQSPPPPTEMRLG